MFFSYLFQKSMDVLWKEFLEKEPSLEEDIRNSIEDALEESLNVFGLEWSQNQYLEAINKKNINVRDFIFYTEKDWKDFVRTLLSSEDYGKLSRGWIKTYVSVLEEKMAQNDNISKYLLIAYIRKSEIASMQEKQEIEELKNYILAEINDKKKRDMYAESEIMNDVLYPFVSNHLVDGCSDWVIEIAYSLTDIYDHISEHKKAMNIASKILLIKDNPFILNTKRELQLILGCTYSYIVANEPNSKRKEYMLDEADKEYKKIREKLNDWTPADNKEKFFIESLYESNLGALYLNKSKMKKGNEKKTCLKTALKHHEQAEEYRIRLISEYTGKYDIEYPEYVRRMYQSKNNIAFTLYEQGEYAESLERHKEVLTYRLNENDISNAYLTKGYIIGCYSEMNKNEVTEQQERECTRFFKDCHNYYLKNGDQTKLKDIIKKYKKFLEKHPDVLTGDEI